MEERGPLGAWLWEKQKECEVKVAELVEQEKQANMLQKSRLKKKAELQDEERRGWSELAVLWQSVRHLHQDTGGTKGSPVVNAPDTPTRPPPYAPPATTGIYPTLHVTSGTIQIDRDGDVGPEDSSSSIQERVETQPHPGHSSVRGSYPEVPSNSGSVKKPDNTAAANNEYTPFVDRQQREEEVQAQVRQGEYRVGEIHRAQRKRELHELEKLLTEWTNREREEIRRNETEKMEVRQRELRNGERSSEGRAVFKGTGEWEGQDEETEVEMDLRGFWTDDEDGEEEEVELMEKQEQLIKNIDRGLKVADEIGGIIRRRTSKRLGEKPRLDYRTMGPKQMPLTAVAGQGERYKPFSIGDVQALVDKLPPVVEGGNMWLNKLDALTAGQRLAMGDFRAVGARCMTGSDLKDIENEAKTTTVKDDAPFTRYSTEIGKAMRERFPLPNAAVVPKMRWDPKQNPREYVNESKELWLRHTGCHPGKEGSQREWFRQAILEGVPESVKASMRSNPDMQGCESHVWEKHLIHHLTSAQDKTQKEQKEVEELKVQLLKLQLNEVRQKTNDKKQKTKPEPGKVMVAAEQQTPVPDIYPTPQWAPAHSTQQGYGTGGYQRGRTGMRGRGFRGGAGGGRYGGPPSCFICRDPNHWARACPLNTRASGPQRGGGRGAGPTTASGTAQASQFPMWEEGYDCSGQY